MSEAGVNQNAGPGYGKFNHLVTHLKADLFFFSKPRRNNTKFPVNVESRQWLQMGAILVRSQVQQISF
jgi:hypothetical protein